MIYQFNLYLNLKSCQIIITKMSSLICIIKIIKMKIKINIIRKNLIKVNVFHFEKKKIKNLFLVHY